MKHPENIKILYHCCVNLQSVNMKHFSVLSCCLLVSLVHLTVAAPRPPAGPPPVFDTEVAQRVYSVIATRSENDPEQFMLKFVLDDGTVLDEEGQFVKSVLPDDKGYKPDSNIKPRLDDAVINSLLG